jgi:hypothetical protein
MAPELDRALTNRILAERWSAAFKDEPSLSSSLIFRARKKNRISHRYSIAEVPASSVKLPRSPVYLDLEFGLKGVLLDSPEKKISLVRPPSDGIVCRFWSHKWSGHAAVQSAAGTEAIDLYTLVPGWKNWKSDRATSTPEEITITHTAQKNDLSENTQVIFFEAFTFNRTSA